MKDEKYMNEIYNTFISLTLLELVTIPCKGKHALVKGYPNRGLATDGEIDTWFEKFGKVNVGVVFGENSRLVGVDVDGESGMELYLNEFCEDGIYPTATFTTPGGGLRQLFKINQDEQLKTHRITLIDDHCEVAFMAQGSYSIFPPSIHPNGGVYKWLDGYSIEEIGLMELPDCIRKPMQKSKTKVKKAKTKCVKLDIGEASNVIKEFLECEQFESTILDLENGVADDGDVINWLRTLARFGSEELIEEFLNYDQYSNSKFHSFAENFLEKGVETSARCTTLGCCDLQILTCQRKIYRNDKNEVVNNPYRFIEQILKRGAMCEINI